MQVLRSSLILINGTSISNIHEDDSKRTTFLAAKSAPWSEVAGTYDLDFGKALIANNGQSRRNLFDDIGDGLEDIGQDVTNGIKKGGEAIANGAQDVAGDFRKLGNIDFAKSVTFGVAVGQPNQVTNLLDQPSAKIDCLNCFVTGSFKVTGHLSVSYGCLSVMPTADLQSRSKISTSKI